MEISIRKNGNVTIIELSGNLIIGRSEESLREAINRLIADEQKYLLLNLADVAMIDSSGIGAMIKSFTSVKAVEGKFKLLKPSRMAYQLLTITGLLSVLETYDDESSAISSF
ncbi:MAG: STAS domain-containing protein [Acidobacteriota bacterium]|nr:MAG: STAS domain-containing protein [Acidobacteriota bacterium]